MPKPNLHQNVTHTIPLNLTRAQLFVKDCVYWVKCPHNYKRPQNTVGVSGWNAHVVETCAETRTQTQADMCADTLPTFLFYSLFN